MGENTTNHIGDKGLVIRTLKELSQRDKPNITQKNALIKKNIEFTQSRIPELSDLKEEYVLIISFLNMITN